jgi:nucleoside transporter
MGLALRLNLSVMMFFQFAIWGAWFVVFFPYLQKLGFTGTQAGSLMGNMALGAIISPMLVGLLADRFISSEKLMAVLHLAGAGLLYWMAQIQDPAQFPLLFIVTLAYALVYNPTLSLTNSIAFTHIPDATRDFPSLRVLGTIGWIAVGFVVGKVLPDQLSNQPLMLAAGLSLFLGLWSFFLPHTPPTGKPGDALPFAKALGLFRDPSFAVFFIVSGIITIVLAFYYTVTGEFLLQTTKLDQIPSSISWYFVTNADGKPSLDVASTMLIGQVVEIVFMVLLPVCLYYMGMKWVLAMGMLAWGVRYALFAVGDPFILLLLGVALHGICFDFFFAAGFIHVDNTAPKDIRGSGQALFALLTYGLGMWIGSNVAGVMKDSLTVDGVTDWRTFWAIPSVGVVAACLVFVVFFRMRKPTPEAIAEPQTV